MVKNRAIDQKNQRLSFFKEYKKGDIAIALPISDNSESTAHSGFLARCVPAAVVLYCRPPV